jgi:monoamine oxidase
MSRDYDLIVIGAGAAGMAAAITVARAGMSVIMLEARDRIGGRIFTVRDSQCDAPVELGAEFIHGRPPEIWNLLKQWKIRAAEVKGDSWCVRDGKLGICDFFEKVDKILNKMGGRKRDQSFLEFLEQCCSKPSTAAMREAKAWATSYVSGFNAADPALVGVHWLVKGMRAEEKIEGDRAFRLENGYADLITIFEQQLKDSRVLVHKNVVVKNIIRRAGHVKINAGGQEGGATFSAPRVLVTVPLGVLQARTGETGAIRFHPGLPKEKQNAINSLAMGKVIRITLRFSHRFWEDLPKSKSKKSKTMAEMSFLFSHDKSFPTWWTSSAHSLPLLTGWASFRYAERLSGRNESFVIDQSLRTLHRLMGVSVKELESVLEDTYCHDWQSDPFSRGAYSYGKMHADGAQQVLAAPVENTLFFAGEATDVSGHNGTVHGAIASGHRAAAEIMKAAGLFDQH